MSTQTHSVAENSMEEIRHASPGARIARTGVASGPTSSAAALMAQGHGQEINNMWSPVAMKHVAPNINVDPLGIIGVPYRWFRDWGQFTAPARGRRSRAPFVEEKRRIATDYATGTER